MTDKIVVISTCGSEAEAERLARGLVKEKLAACVTVIAPVRSFYRWKGEIAEASEWLLVIKSTRRLLVQLQSALESGNSYELPEILALPVVDGSPGYLAWLDFELQSADIE